jgi:hydroxyacylglutathione hydrolase
MIILERIPVGMIQTNCYFFGSEATREIVIVDPGGSQGQLIARIHQQEYKPKLIILTHEHFDHTEGAMGLAKEFGIDIAASPKARVNIKTVIGRKLNEGDEIKIGPEVLEVLESPGHSAGGLILVNKPNKLLFVGDTLFQGSIGRTDLGGNFSVLMDSIRTKIMRNPSIDDEFQVLPGHGPTSTVGQEKVINMFRNDFL